MGFAHVLTGPDHLSALATLSANVGSCKQAFFLGVQWGVGHSAGLLLVGIILIVATSSNQNDTIQIPKQATIFFETMVGIFMISLGSWGVRRALVKRSKISNLLSPSEGGSGIFVEDMDIESTNVHSHDHGFSFSNNITQRSHPSGDTDTVSPDCVTQQQGTSMEDEGEVLSSPTNRWTRLLSGLSTRTLAFIAGVIHGIAGPGGILGVGCCVMTVLISLDVRVVPQPQGSCLFFSFSGTTSSPASQWLASCDFPRKFLLRFYVDNGCFCINIRCRHFPIRRSTWVFGS